MTDTDQLTETGGPKVPYVEQMVLPETVQDHVDAARHMLRGDSFTTFDKSGMVAYEPAHVQDAEFPITFFMINADPEEDSVSRDLIIQSALERAKKVSDFLGFSERKAVFSSLRVFIDSTRPNYEGARAFLQNGIDLWVKRSGQEFEEHELTHWETLSETGGKKPNSKLVLEGIAAFSAWGVKSDEEKAQTKQQNYREIAPMFAKTIGRENLKLDDDFESVVGMYLGGVLFDVLYEEMGNDSKKVGAAYASSLNFGKVSDWVTSLGLDAKKVEEKWISKLLPSPGLS